jgi:hypothetical protein
MLLVQLGLPPEPASPPPEAPEFDGPGLKNIPAFAPFT